jgi:accessory colonization factor AcfC
MRENLERANVVFQKAEHEQYKKFAKEHATSVSQLVRQGIKMVVEDYQSGESDPADLRPIFEQLEKIRERTERNSEELKEIKRSVLIFEKQSFTDIDKVANAVEEVLKREEKPLSIPEMKELLPSYKDYEIISAAEKLENEFVVRRIEPEDGLPKWEIKR